MDKSEIKAIIFPIVFICFAVSLMLYVTSGSGSATFIFDRF